ncbi:protein FAM43A-like protein [Dinothrombium tinctorium]|uniref:Protein FAM43A-like protein n=1 Tax=Dinothrombium tinctorium TaxID=1965070 RepID=A0A3S3P248_9ACAR|nr:protein FAM43A-like protein [Dinothrombium tinctorium]RWS13179.1 protein FAM43A-like protein [Dinothrombium tinctorium]RWS13184.1 protein FAM43A-like protein [Dinothrombium tinctorium]
MSTNGSFKFKNVKIKFWNKKTLTITEYDPVYKVIYLGNVLTPWAKGEGVTDKPLATLWKNYVSNVKQEIQMKLTICNSGLKAATREHGLTEYWANRITYCGTHPNYPKVFCWIYRHEGRKMKQELRCHAVLCNKESRVQLMAEILNERLVAALREYRREKRVRQNARLSLANSCQELPMIPLRKQMLIKGLANFRPPLERSRSAPKLTSIEEIGEENECNDESDIEEEEEEEEYPNICGSISSEGQESTSDIIPDDFDSGSEQLNAIQLTNGITSIYIRDDVNLCVDANCVEEVPNPIQKNAILKCISESIDGEDEDNISNESGYSETADTASSVKSS